MLTEKVYEPIALYPESRSIALDYSLCWLTSKLRTMARAVAGLRD